MLRDFSTGFSTTTVENSLAKPTTSARRRAGRFSFASCCTIATRQSRRSSSSPPSDRVLLPCPPRARSCAATNSGSPRRRRCACPRAVAEERDGGAAGSIASGRCGVLRMDRARNERYGCCPRPPFFAGTPRRRDRGHRHPPAPVRALLSSPPRGRSGESLARGTRRHQDEVDSIFLSSSSIVPDGEPARIFHTSSQRTFDSIGAFSILARRSSSFLH